MAGTGPFDSIRTDSSIFIYIAKLMQNGQVPYLDGFDQKGLLLYVINYIGLCVGGKTGIWIYEIISMFISIIYCYKIAIIVTNNRMVSFLTILCSFAILGIYFQGGNLSEEYALPFIAISLYIFIKHLFSKESSIKTANLIVLGSSFGAVIMLRPNMISVWIVYCVTISIKLIVEKRYKYLIKYPIYFCIGFFVVIIPCIIYLIENNAISDFMAQYYEYNFKYSSYNGIKSILHSIIIFSSTNVFIISMFVYALLITNVRKYNPFIVFSGATYLLLTFVLITISGNIFYHYGMILIPCFIIPVAYLLEYIRTNYLVKYNASIQLIVLLVIISTITNTHLVNFARYYKGSAIRVAQYKSSIINGLVPFIESNTTVNDQIIVFGNNNSIYFESNRYSASKYFYQYPSGIIDKRIATEFIEDIKLNAPILIVDCNNNINKTDMMAVFLKKYTDINYEKYNIDDYNVYLKRSVRIK
jgi:hypothetical protein